MKHHFNFPWEGVILLERKDGITLARKYGLVLGFTVILLITAFFEWGYKVNAEGDSQGPVIEVVTPQAGSTMMTSELEKVTLKFIDSAGLDTNIILQLDGEPLTPEIIWNQPSQAEVGTVSEGTYGSISDDHTRGSIMAALPELISGEHSIYYKVKDSLGNVTESSYVFTVGDNEGPEIKNCYPPSNSIIRFTTPTIALRLDDNSKIVSESVQLYLDGSEVKPSYNSIHLTIRFPVTKPLSEGVHTIRLVVSDEYGNKTDTDWSFIVEPAETAAPDTKEVAPAGTMTATLSSVIYPEFAVIPDAEGTTSVKALSATQAQSLATTEGPVVTDLFPAPGTVIDKSAPLFSFRWSDPDKISNYIIVKVDNQSILPKLTYDGIYKTEYDSCTGQPYEIWIGDDYTKGTVTAQFPNLASGQHTIYYNIKDIRSNITEASYTFSIEDNTRPEITEKIPSSGVVITNPKPAIKAKIVDSSAIDRTKVSMKLNGSTVMAIFDPISSYITYNVPQPLKNGTYSVEVSAADIFGNQTVSVWSFNINDATPPTIANLVPANNGAVSSTTPTIEASVTDPSGITNPVYLKIDNDNFQAQFKSETGKVSFVPTIPLSQGQHTVNMYVYDFQGNKAMASWVFTVSSSGPTVSELTPSEGSVTASIRPVFSLRFSAPYKLDPNVIFKVDNQTVTPTIAWDGIFEVEEDGDLCRIGDDYTKGVISVQLQPMTTGEHTFYYKLKDGLGSIAEKSYTVTISDTQGPQIKECSPANGQTTGNAKPLIRAILNDANLINAQSVYLVVNGQRVNSSYDQNSRTVSYQPIEPLKSGQNNIQVISADELGNSSTNSWSFTVNDTTAPQILSLTPADESVIADSKPVISAKLTDASGIDYSSVVMKFDGKTVGSIDRVTGIVAYKLPYVLAAGTYTVEISVSDTFNNRGSMSWSFTVEDTAPPQISSVSPPQMSGTRAVRPTISAYVADSGGIDVERLSVSLDGAQLNTTFKPERSGSTVAGTVYATPTTDLNNALHTVVIKVFDKAGVSQQKSWQFGINVFGDMTASLEDCTSCHSEEITLLEKKHVAGSEDCSLCHGKGIPGNHGWGPDCSGCHDSHTDSWPPPIGNVPCIQCHNSSFWDVVPAHGGPAESNLHKYSELDQKCLGCHSATLTETHNIYSEESEVQINCLTCHKSSDNKVIDAISRNDKSCAACHGDVNHASLHKSGMDSSCTTCHADNLVDDHLTNRPERNLSCQSCHSGGFTTVSDSVYGQSDNMLCSRCHTEGHGLKLAPQVPSDVPLYPGVEWSTPIDTEIFNDPWMPPEFQSNARILISERDSSLTGNEVWNFYKDKMTLDGWKLESAAPADNSNFFNVTFTKNTRKVRISFYGGENHNAAPVISAGYRIEILYK